MSGAPLSPEWGTPTEAFSAEARAQYIDQLKDPAHLHAICEEYRAAASIDRAHDRADRVKGRRIDSPVLALWSDTGPLASWYADAGGPLEIWRDLAPRIAGWPVSGGHFFPEEHPSDTAGALGAFFSGDS
jgi:haloacetate dehalogenase